MRVGLRPASELKSGVSGWIPIELPSQGSNALIATDIAPRLYLLKRMPRWTEVVVFSDVYSTVSSQASALMQTGSACSRS